MTRPTSAAVPRGFPPTPGSSSDLKAQDGTKRLSSLQPPFELDLPEPALAPSPPADGTPTQEQYRQPAETVKSRRRSAASKSDAGNPGTRAFALPPPPTRSRKIIQMKPQGEGGEAAATTAASSKGKGKGKGAAGKPATAAAAGGTEGAEGTQGTKRKAPSSSSAAGRKIARKTAHSLIERRRRSKMNEEFATLKSMVPACNSGDMHKLTILQATIDYLRYLEDCVDKLQTERKELVKPHPQPQYEPLPPNQLPSIRETFREPDSATSSNSGGADYLAPSSQPASPTSFAPTSSTVAAQHYLQSPALIAQDVRGARQASISSAASGHYGYSHSAGPSPALGPQYGNTQGMAALALTTPPLRPQNDLDHEATAALLMLNSDRRGSNLRNGRALSVRDLLTK